MVVFGDFFPGEVCDLIDLGARQEKQGGIISCIAFDPSGVDLVAFGSYNRSIGLYSTDGDLVTLMNPHTAGHSSGVTHMKFSPDGRRLYTGARLDRSILCWDLRTGKVLREFRRGLTTNQRVYFDVNTEETCLCSGKSDGSLLVWDLTNGTENEQSREADFIFEAVHGDMVNGVSFHPAWSLLATASGQRHVPAVGGGVDDSEDEDTVENTLSDRKSKIDSTVKLWYIG